MVASYSLLACIVFLTATLAYCQYSPYFYNPFAPSQNRRVDEGQSQDTIYFQENDRSANERSIPYNSDAQRIQQERGRIRAENIQLRNGNVSNVFGGYVKNAPLISNRRGELESSHALKFPGPTSSPRHRFVPEIPKECQEMGICEKVPNYPQEHVDQILATHGNLTLFNMDLLTPDIVHRRGPGPQIEELCQYVEKIVYPEAARNIDGEWFFVVNKKQFHVQGFKTEVCTQANEPCNKIAYIPKNYTHSCGQKYTKRTMWSLDQASGNMVMQVVSAPSCCTCFVKPNLL